MDRVEEKQGREAEQADEARSCRTSETTQRILETNKVVHSTVTQFKLCLEIIQAAL